MGASTVQSRRHGTVRVAATVNEYLERADWRVHANANQGYSLDGLVLNVSGKLIANYWLDEVYPSAIGAAHREGDLHIHDLDMLCGYCAGCATTASAWSRPTTRARCSASPPMSCPSSPGRRSTSTTRRPWA